MMSYILCYSLWSILWINLFSVQYLRCLHGSSYLLYASYFSATDISYVVCFEICLGGYLTRGSDLGVVTRTSYKLLEIQTPFHISMCFFIEISGFTWVQTGHRLRSFHKRKKVVRVSSKFQVAACDFS